MKATGRGAERAIERCFCAAPARPGRTVRRATRAGIMAERGWRGELRLDEPMARHLSWRAGGAADRAYFPADREDLAAFLRDVPAGEPVHFVGLGSNLLVRDGGLRGTVILTHRALRGLRREGSDLIAEAGVASPKIARCAAVNELAGAEFLAGIPGTLGGALAMNAGCFGGETWDIVAEVTTIDRGGHLRTRARGKYEVAYRRVALRDAARDGIAEEWFVAARLRLRPGSGAESRAIITDLLRRRIATQPLGEPNAGSVFRNPPGRYAAQLIEACGLKGRTSGAAQISTRHANFIVNRGGASALDIESLIELAERSVGERFGIALEREVRIVGEPGEAAR